MINRSTNTQVASYASVQSGNFTQALWNTKGAAIGLALVGMLFAGCTANQEEVAGPTGKTNVTTEEVADKTNQLLGKPVTVRSEVEKKVGASSFTIGDEKLFGSEKILVINASGQPTVLPDDIKLQVTGKVAKLIVADVEREFNLDLEPAIEVEYKDKPVIIAQSIALAPDPGEVTKNPSAFYNKVIAVEAEVEKILSPISFTLDEDKLTATKDLLVLNTGAVQTIKDGERVVVTGVLRPFILADIERDYDLKWNLTLQKQLEVEYKQKPVLIATAVYPSAED